MQSSRLKRPQAPRKPATKFASVKQPGSEGSKASPAIAQLVGAAQSSATVVSLNTLQLKADAAVQRAKGGKKKGTFIGVPAACHLHIDIASPHFKLGNDKGSRMNFGADYKLSRMQSAYDEIKASYSGRPGYDACIAWLEGEGCS